MNTLIDENDGVDVGGISLRDALAAASIGEKIDFAAALTSSGPATINLTHGQLVISKSLIIDGPGTNLLSIDSSGSDPTPNDDNGDGGRVFEVDDGDSNNILEASISGVTITGGGDLPLLDFGAAIRSAENLTLTDCAVSGNSAYFGAVIYSRDGGTTVTGSTITGNLVQFGSAIYSRTGLVTITDSGISGNSCNGIGSRISNVTVLNSSISGNLGGAGVWSLYGGNLTISGSTVSNNSGDGVVMQGGNVSITNSTINENSGNGISGGNFTVASSILTGNGGMGILSNGMNSSTTVTGCTISNNHGGIGSTGSNAYLMLSKCTISNNSGGGVGSSGSGSVLNIVSSTISGNSGGGIRKSGGTMSIDRSTISNNTSNAGGGIGVADSVATIVDSAVVDNSATTGGINRHGGGIWSSGKLTIKNSTISGNTAGEHGGGIYATTSTFGSELTVLSSTITANIADDVFYGSRRGGGIFCVGVATTLENVIIAGNQRPGDVYDDIRGNAVVRYSLIGTNSGTSVTEAPIGTPDSNGNLIGGPIHGVIDPRLGELRFNGGPTKTHAPLSGSPALDAGDPAANAGIGTTPLWDQRGVAWGRIATNRIDIGSVESQSNPLSGDYNFDGTVDAADYTVWRNSLDVTEIAPFSGADGSGNGSVGQEDYAIWKSHFGQSLPVNGGAGANVAADSPVESVVESEPFVQIASVSVTGIRTPHLPFVGGSSAQRLNSEFASPRSRVDARITDAVLSNWIASRRLDARPASRTGQEERESRLGGDCDNATDDAIRQIGDFTGRSIALPTLS